MMAPDEPVPDSDFEKAAREIAAEISKFREEFMQQTRQDFERELEQVVNDGFDPARGRGRGPHWADGG